MDLELKKYKEVMNESDKYYKFLQKEGYSEDEAASIVYKNIDKIEELVLQKGLQNG